MADESPKTVVLGFDALDFRYLDEFRDSLSNFDALRSEGIEAPLESTFPPWTGSAWPSMYTGVDPGHHGVYGFFHYGTNYPDEATLASRNDVKAPALWNYLSSRDRPSIVLNVPVTHPADPIEGVLIPGYLAAEDEATHPPELREELREALGEDYRIYSRAEMSDDPDEKRAGYLDLIRMRGDAAIHLLTEHDWDVAVIQVQKTDAAFHNFDDAETFRRIYGAADEMLGRIRETVDDANVIVCSDHGIGPVTGYNVYVNEILANRGFVETTDQASGSSLGREKAALTGQGSHGSDDDSDLLVAALSAVGSVLSRVGLSPGDVYGLAQRAGVAPLLMKVVPRGYVSSVSENVDWRRSKAYCRSNTELGVRINLEGREPNGVVSEEEYEAVRDEIIDVFSDLRTPDGEPAFEFVKRREEVYDGPYAEDACDVLFMPTDMNNAVATRLIGSEFVPIEKYDHQQYGAFIADGPAFDGSVELDELALTDVAPTIMAAAGLPVPAAMTGAVPDGLLRGPVTREAYEDVAFGGGADDRSDEEEMEDRLESLGYL